MVDAILDAMEIAVELGLKIAGADDDTKEESHRFTVDEIDSQGRRKFWYCAKCGTRNSGRECVDCGASR